MYLQNKRTNCCQIEMMDSIKICCFFSLNNNWKLFSKSGKIYGFLDARKSKQVIPFKVYKLNAQSHNNLYIHPTL